MKHFTISELLKSDTAIKKRIWNGASKEVEDNLNALVAAVLDPLREKYGHAIYIKSGYRNSEVNKAVGGVSNSQHLKGEAADIIGFDGSTTENYKLGRLIVAMGNFDQVIFEDVNKNDLKPKWIHVSWKRVGDNRGHILKKIKNTTGYVNVTRKELGL